jgi:hypothetical protein
MEPSSEASKMQIDSKDLESVEYVLMLDTKALKFLSELLNQNIEATFYVPQLKNESHSRVKVLL